MDQEHRGKFRLKHQQEKEKVYMCTINMQIKHANSTHLDDEEECRENPGKAQEAFRKEF